MVRVLQRRSVGTTRVRVPAADPSPVLRIAHPDSPVRGGTEEFARRCRRTVFQREELPPPGIEVESCRGLEVRGVVRDGVQALGYPQKSFTDVALLRPRQPIVQAD